MSFFHNIEDIKSMARINIKDIEYKRAVEILKKYKVAIFIVAYNAERSIESVIARIPKDLLPLFAEIVIIDDSSTDMTHSVADNIKTKYSEYMVNTINVYRTPYNRGYGGNQKLGYLYCIEKGYDIVILLHGDGQYPPEYIPCLLASFDDTTDAVFASRMIYKKLALKGGMPIYKWIGNQILTAFENRLLQTKLSEFHTGFRAYKTSALKKLPFIFNSDDFHFDTEIIIQLVANKCGIKEVAIPTYYGEEKCHVNGLKYALDCVRSVLRFRLVNLGLLYRRNYDFGLFETDNYQFKKSDTSLHQYILRNGDFTPELSSIEFGAYRGILSSHIAERVKRHVAVDILAPDLAGKAEPMALDLNNPFSNKFPEKCFDRCVALDVIEHLNEPEKFLTEVSHLLKINGKIYISTANIAYLPLRLMLLLGQFNYGKRGILDRTHKRLFSVRSFLNLLVQYGFRVESVKGFAPPLTDLISNNKFMTVVEKMHSFFSQRFQKLFAYNFLVIATRMDNVSDIFKLTMSRSKEP